LRHYHDGDFHSFFTLFDRYVPEDMTIDDESSLLIFQLHVYFAIHPLHPHCKQPPKLKGIQRKERAALHMGSFREYLSSAHVAGGGAAHSSRTLPYFGLPFVVNPASHPSFQHLFQEEWIMELESRLDSMLEQALICTITAPRIQILYHQSLLQAAMPRVVPLAGSDDMNNGNVAGSGSGSRRMEAAMSEAPSTRITSANARRSTTLPSTSSTQIPIPIPIPVTSASVALHDTSISASSVHHRRSMSQSYSTPTVGGAAAVTTTVSSSTSESAPSSPKESARGDDTSSLFLTALPSSSMAAMSSSKSSSSSSSPNSSPLTSRVIAVQMDVPTSANNSNSNNRGVDNKDHLIAPSLDATTTNANDGDKMSVRMNSGPLMTFRERQAQQVSVRTNNSDVNHPNESKEIASPLPPAAAGASTARAHLQKLHRRRTQQREAVGANVPHGHAAAAARTARLQGATTSPAAAAASTTTNNDHNNISSISAALIGHSYAREDREVARLEQRLTARMATDDPQSSPETHTRQLLRPSSNNESIDDGYGNSNDNGTSSANANRTTSQRSHVARNAKLMNVKERVMKRRLAEAAAAATTATHTNVTHVNTHVNGNDDASTSTSSTISGRRASSGKNTSRNSRSVERTDSFPPVERRGSTRRSTLPRDSVVSPRSAALRAKQHQAAVAVSQQSSLPSITGSGNTTVHIDDDDINTVKPLGARKLVVSIGNDDSYNSSNASASVTTAALQRVLTEVYQCAAELYEALEHDSHQIGAKHSDEYLSLMRHRLAQCNRQWHALEHSYTNSNTTPAVSGGVSPTPPPGHILRVLSSPSPRTILPSTSEPPTPYRNQLFPLPRIEIPRTPLTPLMNGGMMTSLFANGGHMLGGDDDGTTSNAGTAALHAGDSGGNVSTPAANSIAGMNMNMSGNIVGSARSRLSTANGTLDRSKKLAERVLFAPLDYTKISASLQPPHGSHTCLLLQALRWRLNRTRNNQQKKHVLQQYIQADFLSCAHTPHDHKESKISDADLLSKLLHPSSSFPSTRYIHTSPYSLPIFHTSI
jgi:hypothetical protein